MSADWREAKLPVGVTRRVLLVRHGETDTSIRGRCYGKLDVNLSPNGVSQVKKAARLLQPLKPSSIVSSPRIRALDSAKIIGHACDLEVAVREDFAELDFGDFEGMRYEDVQEKYPKFYDEWMAKPTEVTFPNGESFTQMATRVVQAYTLLLGQPLKLNQSVSESTVLVAHGGVIRIILAHLLGLEAEKIFLLDQSYAGISCIDYFDSTPVLRVMNWLD